MHIAGYGRLRSAALRLSRMIHAPLGCDDCRPFEQGCQDSNGSRSPEKDDALNDDCEHTGDYQDPLEPCRVGSQSPHNKDDTDCDP
jgi:hypothetical protein